MSFQVASTCYSIQKDFHSRCCESILTHPIQLVRNAHGGRVRKFDSLLDLSVASESPVFLTKFPLCSIPRNRTHGSIKVCVERPPFTTHRSTLLYQLLSSFLAFSSTMSSTFEDFCDILEARALKLNAAMTDSKHSAADRQSLAMRAMEHVVCPSLCFPLLLPVLICLVSS